MPYTLYHPSFYFAVSYPLSIQMGDLGVKRIASLSISLYLSHTHGFYIF